MFRPFYHLGSTWEQAACGRSSFYVFEKNEDIKVIAWKLILQ